MRDDEAGLTDTWLILQANSQIPSVFNSTQHAHAPNSRKTTRLHRTATLQIGFHDNSQTYMVGWHQMLIAMDAAERSIEAVRRFKEACQGPQFYFTIKMSIALSN